MRSDVLRIPKVHPECRPRATICGGGKAPGFQGTRRPDSRRWPKQSRFGLGFGPPSDGLPAPILGRLPFIFFMTSLPCSASMTACTIPRTTDREFGPVGSCERFSCLGERIFRDDEF